MKQSTCFECESSDHALLAFMVYMAISLPWLKYLFEANKVDVETGFCIGWFVHPPPPLILPPPIPPLYSHTSMLWTHVLPTLQYHSLSLVRAHAQTHTWHTLPLSDTHSDTQTFILHWNSLTPHAHQSQVYWFYIKIHARMRPHISLYDKRTSDI